MAASENTWRAMGYNGQKLIIPTEALELTVVQMLHHFSVFYSPTGILVSDVTPRPIVNKLSTDSSQKIC